MNITGDQLISIFLPSTPNPTTGFYLLVPAKDLQRVDISIEGAFKLIMSAGIVTPKVLKGVRPFHSGLSKDDIKPNSAKDINSSEPIIK